MTNLTLEKTYSTMKMAVYLKKDSQKELKKASVEIIKEACILASSDRDMPTEGFDIAENVLKAKMNPKDYRDFINNY